MAAYFSSRRTPGRSGRRDRVTDSQVVHVGDLVDGRVGYVDQHLVRGREQHGQRPVEDVGDLVVAARRASMSPWA